MLISLFSNILRSVIRRRAALLLCAALACGPARNGPKKTIPGPAAGADADYELANDDDLDAVRDRFEALRRGAARRDQVRGQLVAEYVRRARRALESDDTDRAFDAFKSAVSLWRGVELRRGADLAALVPLAETLFARAARAGSDIEAALALYVLVAADPGGAARHLAELELIFDYSDELAVAKYGEGAERTRSIEILEGVVSSFPSPAVVSKLDGLYRARQKTVNEQIGRDGETRLRQLIELQADLRFAWNLLRIHALGGHVVGAAAGVAAMSGLGEQSEVTEGIRAAFDDTATPAEWVALARLLLGGEDEPGDLDAALEIARAGIRRFPESPELHALAGRFAARKDKIQLAIRLLERANRDLGNRPAARMLGELYEFRVTQLSSTERPRAAREVLDLFERFYERAAGKWGNFEPDLANAYAAMGRGMVSLGDLDTAKLYLERSLQERPTLEALETLGTVALRRDEFATAAGHLERALELPIPEKPPETRLSVQFNHNKLMRLAGEARAGAGDRDRAVGHYLRALGGWQKLRGDDNHQLIPPFAAEALAEVGKLLWHLDKRSEALSAFAAAREADPTSANTAAAIVAFLVVRDRYDDALDLYHQALGSSEVSDYFKIYMSLWMLAEARRSGREVDPFVGEYLSGRDGQLWQDRLARFASGRIDVEALSEHATTRGRRAELLYYRAILGPAKSPEQIKALLEGVIDTDMVMFFEYEMARHWLSRGFVAERDR
jgi:tetratricopeptide (TPR) repeat protein